MRKSRRWLLASMGASVMAVASRPLQGSDKDKDYCEGKAVGVDLGDALKTPLTDKKKIKAALLAVFALGLNYAHKSCNDTAAQNLKTSALEKRLSAIYGPLIDDTTFDLQKWTTLVLHTHILGQLTRYFWRTKAGATLSPKHLHRAWAKFDTATSSCECRNWLCDPDDPVNKDSVKAYVLPKPLTALEPSIKPLQIGDPCALCSAS